MSVQNPEQAHQPSLTERILTACREAYDTLSALSASMPFEGGEDTSPEHEKLSEVIGFFVATNSAALGDIGIVPRTRELEEASNAWLEARLQRRLKSAMYSQVFRNKQEEITKLLQGRSIKATSLSNYGFGVGDGYTLSSGPDNPRTVEAPFLSIDPAQGALWLGESERSYEVQLYDYSDNTIPTAAIEVL